jgi:hypothetical protein
MKTVWSDRSRVEEYQRCNRLRFLSYHEGPSGLGIAPAKKPLPLCVGGAVHKGLETLLRGTIAFDLPMAADPWPTRDLRVLEDQAVAAALADFSTHKSALALDLAEQTAMASVDPASLHAQMIATATDLGMPLDDPSLIALQQQQGKAAAEFDGWLYAEQSSLVEGMVRAYARRRLQPLLTEFEVLEVEREGSWLLASLTLNKEEAADYREDPDEVPIMFMSRPDALLRNRNDNSLYLLSYKTAATWDIRKARDAEHDMQGLSEGVEVERRLGEWWAMLRTASPIDPVVGRSQAMVDYLSALPAPPRIMGIRMEYLLKGSRWADKELSKRFGINVWSQRSHLIRRFVAHSTPSRGKNAGGFDVGATAWSWDYHLEDGSASKLSASNWHGEPVWEHGTVKDWIDALDDTQMAMSAYDSTTGAEPREMGYKGAAQAIGFTATHPLDDVFPAPLLVYRSDDQLRDFIEQLEAQETRVAEAVARVESAADEGERRHLLNTLFVQSRKACSYPSECAMTKICYGGDDLRQAPLESGLYKIRVPHHTPELESSH